MTKTRRSINRAWHARHSILQLTNFMNFIRYPFWALLAYGGFIFILYFMDAEAMVFLTAHSRAAHALCYWWGTSSRHRRDLFLYPHAFRAAHDLLQLSLRSTESFSAPQWRNHGLNWRSQPHLLFLQLEMRGAEQSSKRRALPSLLLPRADLSSNFYTQMGYSSRKVHR